MKLTRKTRLFTFALFIILIIVIGIFVWRKILPAKPICDKCNVVLISIDTLSALHLPCYGYQRNTAPNLCKYADENINFLNSYSQSPSEINSHFSIFTSLYPSTHRMTGVAGPSLNESNLTLAQLYRMNGYKTFYYGPLNNPQLPLNRGFGRGFDFINQKYSKNNEPNWDIAYQKLIENTDMKTPSFFYLQTNALHFPYFTDDQSKHLFANLSESSNIDLTGNVNLPLSPEFLSFCATQKIDNNEYKYMEKLMKIDNYPDEENIYKLSQAKSLQERSSIFHNLSPLIRQYFFFMWKRSSINKDDSNQIEYLKALYDEGIYNMDQNLSKFIKLMADPKLAKNTIIIITADHGEEFMEHGYLYHAHDVYRTSTQVPLIMHIPGIAPKKIPDLVQGIDIYPTVISLTNMTPKSLIEGINLTGLIKGNKNALTNTYIRSEWVGVTAIQSQNLRYYYKVSNKSPIGLYNLTADPGEQNNIKDPSPEVISKFKAMLKQ